MMTEYQTFRPADATSSGSAGARRWTIGRTTRWS